MKRNENILKIGTHSGVFHSDEVFACALLQVILNKELQIKRSRNIRDLTGSDYIIDIGREYEPTMNLFDHHQDDIRLTK